ncbi:GNAT family N-acetyltransferase [Fredinandcohnia sp. QZ13]|uniref:GNAT family N-acetyltransferase n=1 Tax=Fredinandcohnia sp. QZ13 TaxID=3073144 RepID=UPI002853397D|nr:GNAT family N-acetyltransferase [Fredinandcohnia sp. QZ13]MDR4886041.1 GNAT family N-acetyltransferase [Fredinandcohnia sp. QZ13]
MVRVVKVDRDEHLLAAIDGLYREVWNQSIIERLKKHINYDGFRGYLMKSNDEGIIGFSYGYISRSGQYYHNILANELGPIAYEKWLEDCFEFVELAVHPNHRNQGYGTILIHELLKEVTNKTTVLTTQVDNRSARSLYQRLGWVVVKEPFIPSKNDSPYVIMGKAL